MQSLDAEENGRWSGKADNEFGAIELPERSRPQSAWIFRTAGLQVP
jgi:hypothetical protein